MKWAFLIGVLFVFSACMDSDGIVRLDPPESLIKKEKMVDVIKEMTKLEAHVQNKYVSVARYHKVMINSGDSLLHAMGCTREAFESSLEYYGSLQDEMITIYSDALDELNHELGILQEKNE